MIGDQYPIDGISCPACGQENLYYEGVQIPPRGNILSHIRCGYYSSTCPDPEAISKLLGEVEIHHIVRFNPDQTFNVKHPLRERIDDELLDCLIHTEVQRMYAAGGTTEGTWRLKHRDDEEESNEWPWLWEKL